MDSRVAEVNGVEPDEDDSRPRGTLVVVEVASVRARDASNDEMRDGHTNATYDEDRLAAETIDVENGRNGGEEHDDTHNAGGE